MHPKVVPQTPSRTPTSQNAKKRRSRKGRTSQRQGGGGPPQPNRQDQDTTTLTVPTAYLGSAEVMDREGPGSTLFIWRCNPTVTRDRWLSSRVSLHGRWRPHRIRVTARSGCGSLVNGQLGLAWIPDVADIPSGEPLDYLMSQRHKSLFNIRDGGTMDVPCDTEFKWLDTHSEAENGSHGYVVLFVSSPIGGLTNTANVTLTMEGVFSLQMRRVPHSTDGGSGEVLELEGFQGAVLTGGTKVAVFTERTSPSRFQFNKVYLTDPEIPVITGPGVTTASPALVRVAVFTNPIAVLFRDVAAAERFVASPTTTNVFSGCLVATQASTDWITITFREQVMRRATHIERPITSPLPTVALAGELAEAMAQTLSRVLQLTTDTEQLVRDPITITGAYEGEAGGLPSAGSFEGEGTRL